MANNTERPLKLCVVMTIVLPVVTPAEYKNPAGYTFGDFTNRESR